MDRTDEFEEDYQVIRTAIEKGIHVELVVGPLSRRKRELLRDLLYQDSENDPKRFQCWVLKERPRRHGTLLIKSIKNTWRPKTTQMDLMIEDEHPPDGTYDSALVVEDANKEFCKNFFCTPFDHYRREGALLTLENIDEFPIIAD